MNYPIICKTYRAHANGEPVVLPVVVDLPRADPAEYAWRDALEIVIEVSGKFAINGLHLAMQHAVFDVLVPDETPDIDALRTEVQAMLDGLFNARYVKRKTAEAP